MSRWAACSFACHSRPTTGVWQAPECGRLRVAGSGRRSAGEMWGAPVGKSMETRGARSETRDAREEMSLGASFRLASSSLSLGSALPARVSLLQHMGVFTFRVGSDV